MSTIKEKKKELRALITSRWEKYHHAISHNMIKKTVSLISELPSFQNNSTVLIYAPQKEKEIDFVAQLMEAFPHKKYAFPKIIGKNITFFLVEKYRQLHIGEYNILSPSEDIPIKMETIKLIFVPAQAVDKQGNRLGRGGGYYDRFLAYYPSLTKICVLPTFSILNTIPTEHFDIKIDHLLEVSTDCSDG